MVEKINIDNKYFKDFSTYLARHNFKKATKPIKLRIFEALLEAQEDYITDKKIDLEKINVIDYFLKENKKRLDNDKYMNIAHTKNILSYIKKYEKIERNKNINIDTKDYGYYKAIELEDYNKESEIKIEDLDIDEIIPDEDYDYNSLIRNLEKNNNLSHMFNFNLDESFKLDYSKIQRATFKIINKSEDTLFPITYKIICPEPDCNNIVRFTELDLVRPLNCGKDVNEEGHRLTVGNKIIHKSKILYGYNCEAFNNKEFKEVNSVVYSFDEIKEDIIEAEFLSVTINSSSLKNNNFILILSINKKNEERLDKAIIQQKEKYFLEDIYLSLKDYLRDHHNIIVRDDNKIVAHILIFILLSKMFHNKRFYSFVIGQSGGGKTFWAKVLPRLFTGLVATVNGAHVSKNRFLGGTSAKKSVFNTSMIQKGVVGTHDLVVAEEASNALNSYNNNFSDKIDNLFSMIKLSYEELVPITTQGTNEYISKASLFLTGNFEQLNSTKEYLKKVSARYKTLSNNSKYSTSWPLFKSIEYYKTELNNEELAKAHYDVRRFDKDYMNTHYILKLPPAELARFSFLISIENNSNEEFSEFNKLNTNFNSFTHKDQIIEELNIKFDNLNIEKMNKEQIEKYEDFFDEIYKYLKDEFFNKKQNFRLTKADINQHIKMNIQDIARSFFIFQKQFYNKELKLLDVDKKQFEDFMLYNYNTLSKKEASLEEKPYFNDYSDYNESIELDRVLDSEAKEEADKTKRSESNREIDSSELEEQTIFDKMEDV